MIFVILGTQKFQFNRLLEKIDILIEKNVISEKIFAQIGYSTYEPKKYEFKKFLDSEEFKNKIKEANLVITHAGTGAIISALQNNKKVIAVPRLAKFGEHVDDHQKEICKAMKIKGYIEVAEEIDQLEYLVKVIENKQYIKYESNNEKILSIISDFIENI